MTSACLCIRYIFVVCIWLSHTYLCILNSPPPSPSPYPGTYMHTGKLRRDQAGTPVSLHFLARLWGPPPCHPPPLLPEEGSEHPPSEQPPTHCHPLQVGAVFVCNQLCSNRDVYICPAILLMTAGEFMCPLALAYMGGVYL